MRMFLRKSHVQRDPLAVTMSGVRLGERALQIGEGDTRVMALIAARTGLTGRAAIVVLDEPSAARVRRAVEDAGALSDVGVVDHGASPEDAAFDVIVLHDVRRTIAASNEKVRAGWLQLCQRTLRDGGRIVTIEPGAPVGWRAWFGGSSRREPDGRTRASETALVSAGFKNIRVLADREGLRFIEALKID
jgi:hypothetical protein